MKNAARIERLRKKVEEITARIKADTTMKAKLEKEIEALEAAEITAFIRSKKIIVDDNFLQNLESACQSDGTAEQTAAERKKPESGISATTKPMIGGTSND